jgi:hypothetical protein
MCGCRGLPVDCQKSQYRFGAVAADAACHTLIQCTHNSAPSLELNPSPTEKNLQQLQTPFHFSSFSLAVPHSSAAEDGDAMLAPPSGKQKRIYERKIILLKRGQGLAAKQTSSCLLTN